jgi:hypothetical protein
MGIVKAESWRRRGGRIDGGMCGLVLPEYRREGFSGHGEGDANKPPWYL